LQPEIATLVHDFAFCWSIKKHYFANTILFLQPLVMIYFLAQTSPEAIDLGFVELGWFKVLILGIVQGITELLPISSTAHMRIIPSLLGWKDPGSAFSAAMQMASLGAVFSYFWKDIKGLTGGFLRSITEGNYQSKDFRMTLGIIVGTIPISIVGILLKKSLNAPDSPLRGLVVIGVASIVMSLLLAWAEFQGTRKRNFAQLKLEDGWWVGVAQALAIVPGVSRSGSTLTAALFLGMERETAAKFSFLLGLPTVLLAGAVELHQLLQARLDFNGWFILLVGLTSASISAFIAIYGLLRYLENQSTWIFVWYRLLIGLFLIVGSTQGFLH
jgi:undecaprenyl-diphosphatase